MGIYIDDSIVDNIEAQFNSKLETKGKKLYAVFAIAENGEIVSFQPSSTRVTFTNLTENQYNDLPNQNLPFFEELRQSPMYWYLNKNSQVPELAWCWKEGGQKVYCGYSKVTNAAPALSGNVSALGEPSANTAVLAPRMRG